MSQILMLPGWAVPPRLYDSLLAGLADSSLNTVDHGFYSPGEGNDLYAPDTFLPDGELSEDLVIIGHSMGCMHALMLAASGLPLKALVLISPFARFSEDEAYPGRAVSDIDAMIKQLEKKPRLLLKSFFRTMAYPERYSVEIPEYINGNALKKGLEFLAENDCRGILSEIKIPVLIICGDSDAVSSPRLAKYLDDKLEDPETYLIGGIGHALPFTETEKCTELINGFLAEFE